jgi:hypothetical protein
MRRSTWILVARGGDAHRGNFKIASPVSYYPREFDILLIEGIGVLRLYKIEGDMAGGNYTQYLYCEWLASIEDYNRLLSP